MKNNQLTYWAITVALAGFLFGFDTIVISGAEKTIQELWQLDDWFHSTFITSAALWGTVLGALLGGIPCRVFGRKKTLFWIGVLYSISAIGSGLAVEPYSFSFFRFIGGIGVGASSVAAPIYISEIAPAAKRGQLGILYQFCIVFGVFIAFFSNFLIGEMMGENVWRWMLGIEALPALIYTFMVLGVPNSPRWLILEREDENTARQILSQIEPAAFIDKKVEEIKASVKTNSMAKSFFSAKYSWPIMLAFLIAFFNQLSGINFVLYYSVRIFENAGIQNPLASSISIGAVNLIFTFLGIFLIDRVGRRTLLIWGSFGYMITLLGVAWANYTGEPFWVVFFTCAFVGSHAIGQGAIIWVFISEIFPNKMRDYGMSFGSGMHWVFAAIITMVTLPILESLGESSWMIYVFFAGMMFLQLLFAVFMMPETKGVALEDLQKKLMK